MFDKIRAFLLSLTIAAVLVFSAVGTTVAYADGGTDTPPIDLGTAPSPEAASNEDSTPNKTPILDSVPDNTAVTVLNAQGEPQPLATQDAADSVSASDPIWCPATQLTPTPGQNGCTQSFPNFTALLTFLSGNSSFQGDGVIYVEQGAYHGGESTVDFNNFNLSNISISNLTITGGWNTSNNTLDPAGTSTFNRVSLVIGNSSNPWGGNLSLNNLTFTDPNQTGITLNGQKDIFLTNINVTNSNTGAGADITTSGNVTIEKSSFLRNKTNGATIRAGGSVAISESSFSNPANAREQVTGLDINSGGSVSLFQVMANENREAGATINATGLITIVQSFFSGTKSIYGSEFRGYGLTAVSANAIVLDTVEANDNFLWGASLKTLPGGGDVTIKNSTFNANTTESPGFIDDTGLLVDSAGKVTIEDSRADENRLLGATIVAAGDVTIKRSSFASNNGITLDSAGNQVFHGVGLKVVTSGNISLDFVNASDNTEYGAHLEGADVFVSNSSFNNNTTGDAAALQGRGLEIISTGNVFLDTITIDNNQTFGANIQAGGDVFLDTVTVTNNGTANGSNGLQVQTNCRTVFLVGGNYSNNGGYGLSVINSALNQSGGTVFAGNGLGDIFQDPGTCIFTTTTTPPLTPPADDGGSTPPTNPGSPVVSRSNVASPAKTFESSALTTFSAGNKMTLNNFLASVRLGGSSGLHIGLVMGKYALIYFAGGKQIIIFLPDSLNEFAMGGS